MFQTPSRLDTDANAPSPGAALPEGIKALEGTGAYYNKMFLFSGEKFIFCSKNV